MFFHLFLMFTLHKSHVFFSPEFRVNSQSPHAMLKPLQETGAAEGRLNLGSHGIEPQQPVLGGASH